MKPGKDHRPTRSIATAIAVAAAAAYAACSGERAQEGELAAAYTAIEGEIGEECIEPVLCFCTGTSTTWTYGTELVALGINKRYPGTASSAISLDDCFSKIDAGADDFCVEQGLPNNCHGPCADATQSCQPYGEALDKRETRKTDGTFYCRATRGQCACKCR